MNPYWWSQYSMPPSHFGPQYYHPFAVPPPPVEVPPTKPSYAAEPENKLKEATNNGRTGKVPAQDLQISKRRHRRLKRPTQAIPQKSQTDQRKAPFVPEKRCTIPEHAVVSRVVAGKQRQRSKNRIRRKAQVETNRVIEPSTKTKQGFPTNNGAAVSNIRENIERFQNRVNKQGSQNDNSQHVRREQPMMQQQLVVAVMAIAMALQPAAVAIDGIQLD
ncbi:uncharacterized protein LOC119082457 [Bradysia coprophila]|uniref:uncharacterized protein LOC119082457 n=1 Tax=Bradysia coprophila TaxID=38358 RepID=UPI00187DA5FA|nr:uncharacterized protein LOC119082457 [Bradysia coprophila]